MTVNSANQLEITRNNTLLAVSANALLLNTWYFLEFYVHIHASSGSAIGRVNGVEWVSITGANTKGASGSGANNLYFNGTNTFYLDDIYLLNDSGATNNTFLGDVRVETILPNAAGNRADFTPGGSGSSANNYQNVDELQQDGDTSYNKSSTAGHIDSFAFQDLSVATGTIYGIQSLILARKTEAGDRTIKRKCRIGSTYYDGSAVAVSKVDSYYYIAEILETDPSTGSAWTISGINAAEFGYEVAT